MAKTIFSGEVSAALQEVENKYEVCRGDLQPCPRHQLACDADG